MRQVRFHITIANNSASAREKVSKLLRDSAPVTRIKERYKTRHVRKVYLLLTVQIIPNRIGEEIDAVLRKGKDFHFISQIGEVPGE